MKIRLFFLLVLFLSGSALLAQTVPHRVGIFTPLYLDSTFDNSGNARFDKALPRHLLPGLEFYYGIQAAVDSLQKRGLPLEVFVYDSRSREGLAKQLARPEVKRLELMIGQTNGPETRLLADAALKNKVPFVSATFPNDAGVTNNPYFVVLNSTLETHVEAIYRFLQKNHSRDRIVVFRKPGAQEDQLKSIWNQYAQAATGAKLQVNFVDLGADMSAYTLSRQLDSNRKNVCIAGSLDELFATRLTQSLASLTKRYPIRVVGMPTWDNFNFAKVPELELIYTAPFYYNRTGALESRLANSFATRYLYRPGDLFFRGYETMLRFASLLTDTAPDLASNLTREGYDVLTSYQIEPEMRASNGTQTLEYFENKNLYFLRVQGSGRVLIK